VSGYQPLGFYRWPTLLSITILSFYFLQRGTQGIRVRISIVQLGSIELLYVNAQPLHKVKITTQTPRRRIMQSVLAFAKNERKFVLSFTTIDPKPLAQTFLPNVITT
jgi:hypothetical protein